MTRSSLKILLIAIIACPILFYGFDYVNFKMIGFPYAAGSYPFAEGYSFSCDYNDLKTEIEHLRNRDEYHSPANNRLQDRKDENFEHIYFYYKPVNLAFDCIIDSACCNTSSLSLVAVARLNTTENYHERWTRLLTMIMKSDG